MSDDSKQTAPERERERGREIVRRGDGGAGNSSRGVACRCQEVSGVKWPSPKTNIPVAVVGRGRERERHRRCPSRRIVNAARVCLIFVASRTTVRSRGRESYPVRASCLSLFSFAFLPFFLPSFRPSLPPILVLFRAPSVPAPRYFGIPRRRGVMYARHVFKAAKLPGKFIIALIIGKTARARAVGRGRFIPFG